MLRKRQSIKNEDANFETRAQRNTLSFIGVERAQEAGTKSQARLLPNAHGRHRSSDMSELLVERRKATVPGISCLAASKGKTNYLCV